MAIWDFLIIGSVYCNRAYNKPARWPAQLAFITLLLSTFSCPAATAARWQGRAAVGDACPPPPRHQLLSRDMVHQPGVLPRVAIHWAAQLDFGDQPGDVGVGG